MCKTVPISRCRAVKKFKAVHDMTVAGVYGIIRGVSDGLTEIAKITCDVMDEDARMRADETAEPTTTCDDVVDQANHELTMTDAHTSTCL
jgi:hypothetical protein